MEKDSKTKDFLILFRENYKDWFRRVGVKIKKKRAYYLIKLSKIEYIWIYREKGAAEGSRERKTTTPINIDISRVDNFTSKFKRMKGL